MQQNLIEQEKIKEQLSQFDIYKLRDIARALGLKKAAFKDRHTIIDEISKLDMTPVFNELDILLLLHDFLVSK